MFAEKKLGRCGWCDDNISGQDKVLLLFLISDSTQRDREGARGEAEFKDKRETKGNKKNKILKQQGSWEQKGESLK